MAMLLPDKSEFNINIDTSHFTFTTLDGTLSGVSLMPDNHKLKTFEIINDTKTIEMTALLYAKKLIEALQDEYFVTFVHE